MTEIVSDGGHHFSDTQSRPAAVGTGHWAVDSQLTNARAGEKGQHEFEARISGALLAELKETHRLRDDFHREEKSLTQHIKAIERRLSRATDALAPTARMPGNGEDRAVPDGDGGLTTADAQRISASIAFLVAPELFEARAMVHKPRLKYENRMRKIAKELPVHDWMKGIPGFGPLGLAQIIAETGDLSKYSNPSKVWKRMGLHVVNGRAARRVRGQGALEQQYSPHRRAIMFRIGDSLIKKENPYRALYLERKEYEKAKAPDLPPMAHHRRAQRYMEKRLLKHLWQQWRKAA